MAALELEVFSQPSRSVQVPFPEVSLESAVRGGREQQVRREALA
jgi:hypothetical protein